MIELRGAEVSAKIQEETARMAAELGGYVPTLAIVRVGENPDDISYERGAVKKMEKFGLRARCITFPADMENREFLAELKAVNEEEDIDGILLLRPLPAQIDSAAAERIMDPAKDLDGISPENMAGVFAGDGQAFAPCTAEAVIEVLKANGIPIEGKRMTIIGRSLVVGRPLAMLAIKENATVTVCHTRTRELKETCRNAEILVAAAGRAKMVDGSYVGDGAIVIDVGINVGADGKLCGDVDLDAVRENASMATPVPGGVGAVTTAVLAKHLVQAALRSRK